MKKSIATLLLSALLVNVGVASQIGYRYLGRIQTTSPAFLKVEKFPNQPEFLLLSEFGAIISGKVSVIPNIGDIVNNKNFSAAQTHILQDTFKWPNSVSTIPQDVFGSGVNAIVVPDGFLPPGKTEGNIYVMFTNPRDLTLPSRVVQLSASKAGYFYHTGYWIDIDGDGRKDYLTARSNAKAGEGELVWYRQPEEMVIGDHWVEEVLTKGPDVMFEVQESIPGYEDSLVVFAAEFFNKKLTAYQFSLGGAGKTGGQLIASRVIDNQLDQAYSVKYLDINGDGKFELLVNNHESDNSKAAIFLYQVPSDLFNGAYTRTVIANGFKNAYSLFIPNMCPGFPYAVTPGPGEQTHILVAGDGDYSAHLMRPDGTGNFKRETIKYLGGTVGAITTYDFDGDGYLEFFVPNYDNNYIEVYQFYDGPNQVGPTEDNQFVFPSSEFLQ